MTPAIRVQGISKSYVLSHQSKEPYVALRDVIGAKMRAMFARTDDRGDPSHEEFWALRDVSFDVEQGEVFGIIGRNGAGKSTLLKILSRITEPTAGRAELRGRVVSLLEVGTGFHPELTGRENIYLNGAILGMTRAEIKRKFDEIVEFAEVERFLDTPVKRFSSGMYVRLAFAVAAHLEPEVLIVDEVLAVGDAEFQRKCLGKMRAVAETDGRTVLFVSHNMAAIEALCSRAIVLRGGRVAGIGDVDEQIRLYMGELSRSRDAVQFEAKRVSPVLTVESLVFAPNPVENGKSVDFSLVLAASEPTRLTEIALLIYSTLGPRVAILDLRSASLDFRIHPDNVFRLRGKVAALPLVEGDYSVGLYLNGGGVRGNVYDLTHLSVFRTPTEAQFAPYAPQHRGLIELSYEFSRD